MNGGRIAEYMSAEKPVNMRRIFEAQSHTTERGGTVWVCVCVYVVWLFTRHKRCASVLR